MRELSGSCPGCQAPQWENSEVAAALNRLGLPLPCV